MLLTHRRLKCRSAGFSLAEALVALAIAAIMCVALTRFFAGTRANAAKISEALEMATLGETLLTRMTSSNNIKPGRTDGRSEAYVWRIEIAPISFVATARYMSQGQPVAKLEPGGKPKMLSALSLSQMAPETSFNPPAPKTSAGPEWVSYRVALTIEGPSGRRHVADTIKLGQAESDR